MQPLLALLFLGFHQVSSLPVVAFYSVGGCLHISKVSSGTGLQEQAVCYQRARSAAAHDPAEGWWDTREGKERATWLHLPASLAEARNVPGGPKSLHRPSGMCAASRDGS